MSSARQRSRPVVRLSGTSSPDTVGGHAVGLAVSNKFTQGVCPQTRCFCRSLPAPPRATPGFTIFVCRYRMEQRWQR